MKRILIYSPGALQSFGHSYDYVTGITGCLLKKNFEPEIYCLNGDLEFGQNVKTYRLGRSLKTDKKGVFRSILWGFKRIWFSYSLLIRLKSRRMPDDFILFETFEYISLAFFILFNKRIRYACIFHDTNFNLKQSSFIAGVYKAFVTYFVRYIVKRSKCIFVHGSYMRNNLIQNCKLHHYKYKVIVISYGSEQVIRDLLITSEQALSALMINTDKFIILTFGTIRKDKEYNIIIDALREKESWAWIAAGPDGDHSLSSYDKGMNELKQKNQFFRIDRFITQDEQYKYFRACDVVVNLYKEFINHDSGTVHLARKFLKPVLVSGPEDLKDYIINEKVGWYIENKTSSLTSTLNIIEQMGESERAKLDDHISMANHNRSWDKVSDQILRNIKQFLG